MITATFQNKETYNVVTDDVWQWDYGQTLQIEGLDLPTAVEVDFSTDPTGAGKSKLAIGMTFNGVTTVSIPDEMFSKTKIADYTVYAYVFEANADEGETLHRIDIPVLTRAQREEYDEEEYGDLFGQVIETVSEAADKATTAADNAVAATEAAEDILAKVEAAYGNFKSVRIEKDEETGVTTLTIIGDDGEEQTATINDGKSAYEVAVDRGFEGDEDEWLASLKGEKGDPGTISYSYDADTCTVILN